MIGPHERKELDLMLAGEKSLAVFHDLLVEGAEISEEIIPEKFFAPYVKTGKIIRIAEGIYFHKKKMNIHYVCFTLPGQEWRAEFFLWYKRGCGDGSIQYHPAQEHIIGGLLGYAQGDIEAYIKKLVF